MNTSRRYYTTFEASHFLGVSLPTVVNWIKANRLKAHRTPGGHRRIARDELAAFIRRHGMPMPPELGNEGSAARMLVVVDNKGQAESMTNVAKKAGFEVESSPSGFAAGLAIGRMKPDVLLVDLAINGMDAYDALSALRANESTKVLPVIAVAGARDDKAQKKALSAGFNDFMQKPLDLEELQRKVDEVMRAQRSV
jgi:excisionase family DNA binding protein